MSKKESDDCPVPDKLCSARSLTLEEMIKAIKNTIYDSSAAIAFVVVLAQFILTHYK